LSAGTGLGSILDTGYVLADKAYDSEEIIFSLSFWDIVPIILPKINRKSQRFYDKNIYKKRPIIEKFVPQNEGMVLPFYSILQEYSLLCFGIPCPLNLFLCCLI
jgi:hypothetical protein